MDYLRPPKVARVVLRGGEIDASRQIIHHELCRTSDLAKLVSEQLDREQRREISYCEGLPKEKWRHVFF